jgi:hypothetical protein
MIGKLVVVLTFLALGPIFLSGCASLTDGKFVTKDGKDTPFNPMVDRYAPPKNPTYDHQ